MMNLLNRIKRALFFRGEESASREDDDITLVVEEHTCECGEDCGNAILLRFKNINDNNVDDFLYFYSALVHHLNEQDIPDEGSIEITLLSHSFIFSNVESVEIPSPTSLALISKPETNITFISL